MADTYTEARDAIFALVLAEWNTQTNSAPLLYANDDDDRPEGGTWGRLTLRYNPGGRANIGPNARFRRTGMVYLQLFVPKNTGLDSTLTIGEALVNELEDTGQIGNLWFRDVSLIPVGADVDQAFFQTNVEAAFTYDRKT